MNRRRVLRALLALLLPAATALTALPMATTSAIAAAPAVPPSCAWNDPDTNCVHAATPDITALPTPSFTTTYNAKQHSRSVTFVGAVTPPYHTCPAGGVPISYLPCSFAGLTVTARVYVPGASAAAMEVGATPAPGVSCDFTCTVTAAWDSDFHGPATIILKFAIGDLLLGQNDLTSSVWETSITLPASPVTGTIQLVKSKVLYSGKLRTMTLQLGGKDGVPKTGVGGVLVRLVSNGLGLVRGGDQFDGIGDVMAIPGTTVHIVKEEAGTTASATLLGWWSKAPATTGGLFHRLLAAKKMKISPSLSLRSAGVPADATGAVIAVVIPKGSARIGGLLDNVVGWGQYLVVPLKTGAKLSVNAPKGTKLWVYGYVEPIHVIDQGSWISTFNDPYPEGIDQVFGLEGQEYIS
jgi:hypothetical protein